MCKIPRKLHLLGGSLVFLIYSLVATSAIADSHISLQAAYPGLFRVMPEPELSVDGNTLYNALQPVLLLQDPNPANPRKRYQTDQSAVTSDILPPDKSNAIELEQSDQSEAVAAAATFVIDYVPSGGQDPWGEGCQNFPENAKAAFNAAGAVWSGILQSSVPIRISACWANLGSSNILGYSGGGTLHRNFTNAPKANTWYIAALANSLTGSDLAPSDYDMYITYNSSFSWYYGIDSNTPLNQIDLMSVVLHEIGHGLNFGGSMDYLNGYGYWGYGTVYPNTYDTFMKSGAGTGLTSYTSGTTALGTQLVSNNIWFHGANAMNANGGVKVKMYAPTIWSPGSSYSHLDYNTFNETVNELMVYAISYGEAVHDPGPVIRGLLQDLGWGQQTGGQPDFVVTRVTLNPGSPTRNRTFSATVTVKNQGTASGDGRYLDVWTNQATSRSCGAAGNQRKSVGTLAAGASATFTFTSLSAGTRGSKTFRGFVDSQCGTAESNEGNNQLTKTYTVN